MSGTVQSPSTSMSFAIRVMAGEDLYGERHSLGIGNVDFKASAVEGGGLFVAEITLSTRGGPARHLHHGQDEWFYIVEGEFILEVGQDRFRLQPGDSVFGPREVPHVWANVGNTRGKFLAVFSPAGKMEGFFREAANANAAPTQDSLLWRAHGMEAVGPPLGLD
jgi:mannose-6-phosphate isomerase-like protein (cupin superfamily)